LRGGYPPEFAAALARARSASQPTLAHVLSGALLTDGLGTPRQVPPRSGTS